MRCTHSLILFGLALAAHAQDITGRWMTIDDNSGKARSVVAISVRNGKAVGTIVKLFRQPDEEQDPICTKCTDDRKGRKVSGLDIIRDLERDGTEWNSGTILDPENGKVYDCKLWIEGDDLKMRGYIGFFFRTQTWVREPQDRSKY